MSKEPTDRSPSALWIPVIIAVITGIFTLLGAVANVVLPAMVNRTPVPTPTVAPSQTVQQIAFQATLEPSATLTTAPNSAAVQVVPLETQVWLDLTHLAETWTDTPTQPPTATPNITATYVQLLNNAAATLTAAAPTSTPVPPTLTPTNVPTNIPLPTSTPVPPTSAPAPAAVVSCSSSQEEISEQVFEYGRMYWVKSSGRIWVVWNSSATQGSWGSYPDNFLSSDPWSDPSIVPPAGRLQPERGFGKLWRETGNLRAQLGWATTVETYYSSPNRYYPAGTVDAGGQPATSGFYVLCTANKVRMRFYEDRSWRLENS